MNTSAKRLLVLLFAVTVLLSCPLDTFATSADAKKTVVNVSKNYINLGFDIQDNFLYGFLIKGKSVYVTTTLFQGNEYVLIVGGSENAVNIDMEVYDENLRLLKQDNTSDKAVVLKITPSATGKYHLKITMQNSKINGAHWCCVTGYK